MPIRVKIENFPKPGAAVLVNFESGDDAEADVKVFINDVESKNFLLDGKKEHKVTVASGSVVFVTISNYGAAAANDSIRVKAIPGDGPNAEGVDTKVFSQ